jgi:hypothetical protein
MKSSPNSSGYACPEFRAIFAGNVMKNGITPPLHYLFNLD